MAQEADSVGLQMVVSPGPSMVKVKICCIRSTDEIHSPLHPVVANLIWDMNF